MSEFDWTPGAQWMTDDSVVPEALEFHVNGVPVAQGSKRHVGGGKMIETSKALQPWREAVIDAAQRAADGFSFFGPCSVSLTFNFPRPKGHYGTGRNAGYVKNNAPLYKRSAPDIDKLVRAVLDGMVHAGVLRDDSLVVVLHATKFYSTPYGVRVRMEHV